MKRWLTAAVGAAGFAGMVGVAHAQACVGFGDVLASDALVCPAVEWVKNRSVTQGCDTGLYCPTNNVTRAQMAIFMKRLGEKLSPNVLHVQHSFPAEGSPLQTLPAQADPPYFICVTDVLPAAPYPRQVTVVGSVSLQAATTANYRMFALLKTGANWANFYPPTDSVAQRSTIAPGGWGGATVTESVLLAPNTEFQFALALRRDNVVPSASSSFSTGRCQLTASVTNFNGTASPF